VRRIEVRLFGEEGDVEVPALAGSFAAGCAWSGQPPVIGEITVGRVVVAGGGLAPGPVRVLVGGRELRFASRAVTGGAPADPIQGLQNAMREAEADLAEQALKEKQARLVVSDGPLTYFGAGPLVGLVKRQSRPYLDAARAKVLGRLAVAERSPIFKLGQQRLERYSWYLRIAQGRAIDGAMTGVVRLEVAATDGLEAARALADLAAVQLPRFATRPAHDPRAPQNLYPVAALEGTLRRRLGDTHLIRRALEVRLAEEVTHG